MNPQERAMLESFLYQLVQDHAIHKVQQADAMIRRAVERQPDAAYLLVQKSLMLQQALEQARARIAELELDHQDPDRSFLEGGASNATMALPAAGRTMAAPQRPPGGRADGPSQATGGFSTGSLAPEPSRGAGATGSFLGQAAATAAGVAGGAFLFQGIESLLGPHGSAVAGHETAQAPPPEDVTVNNYYASDESRDQPGDKRHEEFGDADETPDDDSDSGNYLV